MGVLKVNVGTDTVPDWRKVGCPTPEQATAFGYSGAYSTFTVPTGITSLTVDAYGAQGGSFDSLYRYGGLGGRVQATIAVTPGEVLRIYVGQQPTLSNNAGFNGGGSGGPFSSSGRGGGGATDIRRSPYGLADRLVVAGGGGGSGSDDSSLATAARAHGGVGGSGTGGQGGNGYFGGAGGGGGSQSAGGVGYTGGGPSTATGSSGALGIGGDGYGVPSGLGRGGGGGGGGYYGGGGGPSEAAGGGGGSSYSAGTILLNAQGVRVGHGALTITHVDPAPEPGRLKLWDGTQWLREACDGETVAVIADTFTRADGTGLVANRSDGGLWTVGSAVPYSINSNRLTRDSGSGLGAPLNNYWLGAEHGALSTISIAFDISMNINEGGRGRVYYAKTSGGAGGYQLAMYQAGGSLTFSTDAGATIATATGVDFSTPKHVVHTHNLITGAYSATINGAAAYSGTASLAATSGTWIGFFLDRSYAANASYFDNIDITGPITGHPLKLNVGTADAPDWVTVACMTPA